MEKYEEVIIGNKKYYRWYIRDASSPEEIGQPEDVIKIDTYNKSPDQIRKLLNKKIKEYKK